MMATKSEQSVVSVQGCHPICLGHRRVIECRVDEIHQRILRNGLRHDRLPNMYDLARVCTKAVDPENLERFSMKQNLEHADRLTRNLSTGDAFKMRVADFVGNHGIGQLALGFSQGTD